MWIWRHIYIWFNRVCNLNNYSLNTVDEPWASVVSQRYRTPITLLIDLSLLFIPPRRFCHCLFCHPSPHFNAFPLSWYQISDSNSLSYLYLANNEMFLILTLTEIVITKYWKNFESNHFKLNYTDFFTDYQLTCTGV